MCDIVRKKNLLVGILVNILLNSKPYNLLLTKIPKPCL
ncbi:hypothetical protein SPBRAN_1761 [uncultured Candidatus Thioglobus sp.]|nr:hypothetical protein SPBRAN_1761 [uncultured Candidatus Thioglobus sp.]